MNLRRIAGIILAFAGIVAMVLAMLIMPERMAAKLIPAGKDSYLALLSGGLRFLRMALVVNGIILVAAPWWLKLWNSGLPVDSAEKQEEFRFEKRDYVAVALVCLAALLARLPGLSQSFFVDEIAVQTMFIDRGLAVILSYMPAMPQHVLYSILAWVCERGPWSVEVGSRLPAAVFGVLVCAVSYLMARRFLGLGVIGSVLAAIPLVFGVGNVVYSQMAKGYTGVHFFFILAIWAIMAILRRPHRDMPWIILGLSAVAMIHFHLFSIFIVAGLAVSGGYLMVRKTLGQPSVGRIMAKRIVITGLVSCSILLLLYSLQIPQIMELSGTATTSAEEKLTLSTLRGLLGQWTFWGQYSWLSLALPLFAFMGLGRLFKRNSELCTMLVLPVVITFAVVAIGGMFVYPRYFLFAGTGLVLLAAEGVIWTADRLRLGKILPPIIIAAMLALTSGPLAEFYRIGNQNLRDGARLASGLAGGDGRAYGIGLAGKWFRYYADNVEYLSSPSALDDIVARHTGTVAVVYAYQEFLERDAMSVLKEHFILEKQYPGFWMDSDRRNCDVYVWISKRQ